MSISFSGLGSGLNYSSWINQLVNIKQASVTTIQNKNAELQNKINSIDTMKSAYTELGSAVNSILNNRLLSSNIFTNVQTKVSQPSYVSAKVDPGTAVQDVSVGVIQLAKTTSISIDLSNLFAPAPAQAPAAPAQAEEIEEPQPIVPPAYEPEIVAEPEVARATGAFIGAVTPKTQSELEDLGYVACTAENLADENNTNFYISSAAELQALATATNDGVTTSGRTFTLAGDIDLSSVCSQGSGTSWTAIGNYYFDDFEMMTIGYSFSGTFDGNGHVVRNLYIDSSTDDYQGLFGKAENAVIRNLGVEDVNITGGSNIGGLAGYCTGTISNCYVKGTVTNTLDGGNCYDGIGGLVGYGNGTISNCYTDVDVTASDYCVGGLAGNYTGEVTNCFTKGNVTVDSYSYSHFVGGIVGCTVQNEEETSITNCYAKGDLLGNCIVGGIVGYGDGASVANCYTTGNLSGMGNAHSIAPSDGGIGFSPTSITNCYATGLVNGVLSDQAANQASFDSSMLDGTIWNTSGANPVLKVIKPPVDPIPGDGYINSITQKSQSELQALGYVACTAENLAVGGNTKFYISSAEELQALATATNSGVNTSGRTFTLSSDIDLSTVCSSALGNSWTAIGDSSHNFNGTFDGNGHIINNLYIDGNSDYQGLFGYAFSANIKNVGIENADITGNNHIGGLVGCMECDELITNCYVTGSVTGNEYVGGLVGDTTIEITNSYTNCTVTGKDYVGGLVGHAQYTSSTISNCYAIGNVNGVGEYTTAGGLVGVCSYGAAVSNSYTTGDVTSTYTGAGLVGEGRYNDFGNSVFSNCYTTGNIFAPGNDGAICAGGGSVTKINCYATGNSNGSPAHESTNQASFDRSALDEEIWDLSGENPVLRHPTPPAAAPAPVQVPAQAPAQAAPQDTCFIGSITQKTQDELEALGYVACTAENLAVGGNTNFYISSAEELQALAAFTNDGGTTSGRTFTLSENIDLSSVCSEASGVSWTQIGQFSANCFFGTFDGNGHVISNLYINNNVENVGLFGYTSGATLKNVGLENVDITGGNFTGALAGLLGSSSSVTNCYVTGDVSGTSYTGGLIGETYSDTLITNCYSSADVNGTNDVGGLAGHLYDGSTTTNCFATGDVSGTSSIGGLVGGLQLGYIDKCYATGNVSGSNNLGGLVYASNSSSVVRNSYSTGNVTGGTPASGLPDTAYTTVENCYATGLVNGVQAVEASNQASFNDSVLDNALWDKTGSNPVLRFLTVYSAQAEDPESEPEPSQEPELVVPNLPSPVDQMTFSSGKVNFIVGNSHEISVNIDAEDSLDDIISKFNTAAEDAGVENFNMSVSGGRLNISADSAIRFSASSTSDFVSKLKLSASNDRTSYSSAMFLDGDAALTSAFGVTTGTFTIGEAEITIDENTTMNDVISAINNNENSGVTASFDATNGKLNFTSKQAGEMYISFGYGEGGSNFTDLMGLTSAGAIDLSKQELGQNAIFTINGEQKEYFSNELSDTVTGISGLSLKLKKITDEDVNISIEQDTDSITDAMSALVDAYNNIITKTDELTKVTYSTENGETKSTKAALAFDFQLTSMLSALRNTFSSTFGNADINRLSQIGVKTQAAGASLTDGAKTLEFDREAFIEAFKENPDEIMNFLIGNIESGEKGIMDSLKTQLDANLDFETGYFASRTNTYNSEINRNNDKISRMKSSIETYRASLEKKFSAMDTLISSLNSQYSYLTSTLSSLFTTNTSS